ncbi:hypothetical protein F5880DRAFT_1616400 [Lentinula raphanica]|nr:hypothetical protein F5880DRAFT_1616400 [Lentinula raphanica]
MASRWHINNHPGSAVGVLGSKSQQIPHISLRIRSELETSVAGYSLQLYDGEAVASPCAQSRRPDKTRQDPRVHDMGYTGKKEYSSRTGCAALCWYRSIFVSHIISAARPSTLETQTPNLRKKPLADLDFSTLLLLLPTPEYLHISGRRQCISNLIGNSCAGDSTVTVLALPRFFPPNRFSNPVNPLPPSDSQTPPKQPEQTHDQTPTPDATDKQSDHVQPRVRAVFKLGSLDPTGPEGITVRRYALAAIHHAFPHLDVKAVEMTGYPKYPDLQPVEYYVYGLEKCDVPRVIAIRKAGCAGKISLTAESILWDKIGRIVEVIKLKDLEKLAEELDVP